MDISITDYVSDGERSSWNGTIGWGRHVHTGSILQSSLQFVLLLFLNKVVDEDARHVVGIGQNYRLFHASKREARVDTSRVTFNGI